MGAQAHEIGAGGERGDVEPAERLHGVGVDDGPRSPLAHEGDDGVERLAHAGLVVDEHHRDETHGLVQRVGERVEVDDAATVDRDGSPARRQARLQHGGVLHGAAQDRAAGGDLRATRDPGAAGDAADGEVVGLGAAAREDDLAWVGTEQAGELLPGVVEGALGRPRDAMGPGRVAVTVRQERQHRRDAPPRTSAWSRRGRDRQPDLGASWSICRSSRRRSARIRLVGRRRVERDGRRRG